jgi:hypothetical protein
MDYAMPEPVAHYKAIMRGLARLSGAHRGGRLSPGFDEQFPVDLERIAAASAIDVQEEKLLQRANRMFDFIERYPQLFPADIQTRELRHQFISDIADVVAAADRIKAMLNGNPDFIAFAHWNANVDNCWFWRDAQGSLQCGFIDWANVGQISLAQSINGALSGAEPFIWDDHLDELLAVYIEEYAAQGGPLIGLEELRRHTLLVFVIGGMNYAMGAPIAIEREVDDIDAIESYRDSRFSRYENARIQLHMMTRMLSVWQTQKLGDMVRALQ